MDENLIFSVDPSSTRTGWALMNRDERLLQAGVMLPDKIRSEPQFRIGRMCEDLRQLLTEFEPDHIVIEITSGKVGLRRHTGLGAGLAIYGMSIGALWREAEGWLRSLPVNKKGRIHLVLENDWTGGVTKQERVAEVANVFSQYKIKDDPGGDIADAIGLAVWFIRENKMRTMV
jgi:Holliday junction resolvasome RuvABC endonuclease subunit